jgi:hypothetical protein
MTADRPARSTRRAALAPLWLAALAVLLAGQWPHWTVWGAQLSYSRGQGMSPAFEGWEQAADGSRYFLFGYMNRNWEEEFDIPVGRDNNIEPGGPDQGQPTHFFPRRNPFVFRIRVPGNFGEKDELVWTLTTHGQTERAYATLKADYFVDDLVRAMELGAVIGGNALDPEIYRNQGPTLKVDGEKRRSAKVGQAVTLVAWAADDGIPKRRGARKLPGPGGDAKYSPPNQGILTNPTGLRLSWFVYRGAGKVTFSPEQTKVWQDTRPDANSPWAPFWAPPPVPSDGKWVVQASFDEPGEYVVRCLASDGALLAYEDLTISVIGRENRK